LPDLGSWTGRAIEPEDILEGEIIYLVGNSDPRIIYTIHFAYRYLFMVARRLLDTSHAGGDQDHDIDDGEDDQHTADDDAYDRDIIFEPTAGVITNMLGGGLVASDFQHFKDPLYKGPDFRDLRKMDAKFVLLNHTTLRAVHVFVPKGENLFDIVAIGGSTTQATIASVRSDIFFDDTQINIIN